MATILTTARLRLVPMTLACTASPDDRVAIGKITNARVPDSWPVEHYDDDALEATRNVLERDPVSEFVMRYIVTIDEPTVIGIVGCSPPANGRVMVGYSVDPAWQRRGYASEALAALIDSFRSDAEVIEIIADTYPDLVGSIRTMQRCGLTFIGPGEEEGVIRHALKLK